MAVGAASLVVGSASATQSDPSSAAESYAGSGVEVAAKRGVGVFRDKSRGDRRGIDIFEVGVVNRRKDDVIGVTVTSRNFTAARAQVYEVWIDANPKRKGPEYRIVGHSGRDPLPKKGTTIAKVRGFRSGTTFKCGFKQVRFEVGRKDQVKLSLAKKCIGGAKARIRANATVWDITKLKKNGSWRGYADYAPGKNKLTPWVRS